MSGQAVPPPPSAWRDHNSNGLIAASRDIPTRLDIEQVSNAWKHCKNVSRDEYKSPDLYDLLSHSVRETQYSFQPQGWPSPLRPLSPIVSEMPAMVMDRYNACQTVAFCGVFPEIRRAWASVDNSLFMWRFGKWQDVPIEYSGEQQAIVAVGLVKPRPGVFVEAIKYLLVVCTATEVALIGVCCSKGSSGTSNDDTEEVTLQPLPLYHLPSDNVTMVSIASTEDGRIFLGGADGHLYEIQYSATDSWRTKRMSKICHTGGLRQLLPSFLPGLLFGPPTALVDIKIDDARHILYARTQGNGLQVFDLGADGSEAPKKAAETTDCATEASRALSGREVFGRGAGDRKGGTIVFMAPIPPSESQRLHLLTVTADGRRVYWSVASSRYAYPTGGRTPGAATGAGGASSTSNKPSGGPRPDRLRAEIARQAMPSSSGIGRSGGGGAGSGAHHHLPARGLQVTAALYTQGTLILAEGAEGESRTRVFLLSRDLTIPPVGTATGAHVAVQGLREAVTELDMIVPGEACSIKSVPLTSGFTAASLPFISAAESSVRDELTSQNAAPPSCFVLVTTAGVLEVEKLRPADILAQLLEERNPSKLELFFKSYGAPEAAAMCIQLGASGPPFASAAVIAAAKAALDDSRLCGEPGLREGEFGGSGSGGYTATDENNNALTNTGFDMGGAVPVTEPEWSAAHKGLCLYLARVLAPVWDAPVVVPTKGSKDLLKSAFAIDDLQVLEERLRRLDAFLSDYIARRKARRPAVNAIDDAGMPAAKRQRLLDAHQQELKRSQTVLSLVSRTSDACFLLRVLCEHNVGRLAARVEDNVRSQLRAIKFRDWVAGDQGETTATQLISVLVSEHLSGGGEVADDLAASLQRGCPSYFRDDDRLYYSASGLLRRAEGAATIADREALSRDAVALMGRVPLACDLGQVIPQLALLRAVDAVIELPLKKAAALDPSNTAALPGEEGSSARSRREETAYNHAIAVLKVLIDPQTPAQGPLEAFQKSLSTAERQTLSVAMLRKMASTQDDHFQHAVFTALIELGAVKELLQMDTPYLEQFLITAGGLSTASSSSAPVGPLTFFQVASCEALARYYIQKERYAAAAGVHELLAARIAAPGEQGLTLDKRALHLQAAVLQARSFGDAGLVDRLQAKLRLAVLQQRLAEELQRAAEAAAHSDGTDAATLRDELEGAAADLKSSLKELPDLYNEYARRYQLWDMCLELVDVSSYRDDAYVRQLWDLFLKAKWQQGYESASSSAAPESAVSAGLQAACAAVADLGERFYPNEVSFPASHVVMRLEQAAAGLWPDTTANVQISSEPVVHCLVKACSGAFDPVVRAYEALFNVRGSDPHGEELHSPFLRLRLLQSLKNAIQAGRDKLADSARATGYGGQRAARRELGVLAAACEAYAAEARRMPQQGEGETLAVEFEKLLESLQPLMAFGGGY